MAEHIQMLRKDLSTPGLCATDIYKELFISFKERDLIKMEELLKNSEVDPDYRYGDPEYGSLLDLCTLEGNRSDMVDLLLEHGANPNLINPIRKKGPIHFASQSCDIDSLRRLVKHPNTDINLLDNTGSTALHHAAANKDDINATAVKLLIQFNADLNLLNRKGKSPLNIALKSDHIEAIKALVEAGADLSIEGSDDKTIKEELAKNYPDISLPTSNNKNYEKITHNQLFGLLRARKFDEFRELIRDNKHLLELNDGYHTFLQYCCEFGFVDVVKTLLDMGACPNTTNPALKLTPLMLAARKGFSKIVGLFTRRSNIVDFGPIDGETPLHYVVNGMLAPQNDSDYLECLTLLLTQVPKSKLNINQRDFKGNTVLHYAGKLRQDEVILLLLQHGAYIGEENDLGEAACADIPYSTFLEHLDSCINTNDALPREDSYEIIFNYNFLLPIKSNSETINNGDIENNTYTNRCLKSETMPLLHIASNPELRQLLKHPIFTSFLHLKWHRIRRYFYINLLFYLLFWIFLTVYILNIYSDKDNVYNSVDNHNLTTTSQMNAKNDFSVIWCIVTLLLILLILRETFQLYISPIKYLLNPENWLEIGIIIVTIIILFGKSTILLKHQISAIGIMLSWAELVLLIGRHPALSTNIEMLKTVSYNFLKFLAWYSILIVAFALSFYSLFKDTINDNDEENFFEDPGTSLFKTVVMLTGEFEAGSIPFVQHPITSHILFVLFVFMIAIVLFNLLNGLAVSDTQAIRSDAELVSIVSRAKLVSYLEKTLANPSSIIEGLSRCLSFVHKPISTITLATSLPSDHAIRVLVNMGCILTFDSLHRSSTSLNKRDPTKRKRVDQCPTILTNIYMDPSIVERASHVLIEKSDRLAIRNAEEESRRKERQMREEMEHFRHCINNLTEMVQENKKILDSISKVLTNESS